MQKTQSTTRGVYVYGDRLKQLRKKRGWTQQELADRSGYCDRLIRKAELNGSVSEETLEVLAITLSDTENQITPEELSLASLAASTLISKAIFSPDFVHLSQLTARVHSQILIDCLQVSTALPLHGIYRGHQGLIDWLTTVTCLIGSERVAVVDHVMLENSRYGYLHGNCLFNVDEGNAIPFEIDLRLEMRKSKIVRAVWLSTLGKLAPIAFEWEQLLKSSYQRQIRKKFEEEYAQSSA